MVAFGEGSETSAELAHWRGGSCQESVPVADVAEVVGHRCAINEFPIDYGLQEDDGCVGGFSIV